MCLKNSFDILRNWKYYDGFECVNYSAAIENPIDFVRGYFAQGAKLDFLFNSIFDDDNANANERALHTVNTYFLGVYLFNELSSLQFSKRGFLGQSNNFLWAWFICSLYHDAFYNIENQSDGTKVPVQNYSYCDLSRNLLYNQNTINKYYRKEINPQTRHSKNTPHYDHGISAATMLYQNYICEIERLLSESDNNLFDFINGHDLFIGQNGNLRINIKTYHAICKIAKIIACHNIFICSKKDDLEKYEQSNLCELILTDNQFKYMPNKKSSRLCDYEKLYFLMTLVDTLEPTKRKIPTDKISIKTQNYDDKIELIIAIDNNIDKKDSYSYFKGIKSLGDWLNFVSVEDEGRKIIIDFNNNKKPPRTLS